MSKTDDNIPTQEHPPIPPDGWRSLQGYFRETTAGQRYPANGFLLAQSDEVVTAALVILFNIWCRRYYWMDKTVKLKMIHTTLNYGFEYLGNTNRLGITPLTDR